MGNAALRGVVPLLAVCAVVAGCHALFGRKPWGDERIAASQETSETPCDACHADVVARHVNGPHGRKGIICGQCHRGGGHPHFDEPLDDGTCGGCHLPEYQQVARSAHARGAVEVPAKVPGSTLRVEDFRVRLADGTFFVTRDAESRPEGRLCVGCHYDHHDLSASSARSGRFCESCHTDRGGHYPQVVDDDNRCLPCHMQQGVTIAGQTVTSHAFSGHEGTGQ